MYKHYVYVFCIYSYQKNYPALSEYQVHLIVVYVLTLYCVFGVILPTSGCTLNILHLFNSNRFLHHFPCKYSKDSTIKYHQIKCECIQFLYDPQHTNLIIILNVHLSYLFFIFFEHLHTVFVQTVETINFLNFFSQYT